MKNFSCSLLIVFSLLWIGSISAQPFFWGFAMEGFPITKEALEMQYKETLLPSNFVLFYIQWPISAKDKPSLQPTLKTIWEMGAVPCLTWEPMYSIDDKMKAIPHKIILSGGYDEYMQHIAKEIQAFKHPVIVRFAHEMNLSVYHWGVDPSDYNELSPGIYKKMYQYVVNLFKKQGVQNALWAFCPNADSVPLSAWNKPSEYYPGDSYIDILGMDGYNWDMNEFFSRIKKRGWTSPMRSFDKIFSRLYRELRAIAPSKPILVFETATVDRSRNGKTEWIKDALETVKKWNVLGIIWFQVNKEEDWRINSSKDYSYVPVVLSALSQAQSWAESFQKKEVIVE